MGDFPPPGQMGQRATSRSSLLLERKRARPIDADRHRRIHLDKCFSCFDLLERGRVPSGVLWGGLALMAGAPELGKVKFILSIYDADRCGEHNSLRGLSACVCIGIGKESTLVLLFWGKILQLVLIPVLGSWVLS